MSHSDGLQLPAWGVELQGHAFDLEDCKDVLKPPFDPWVVEGKTGLVLRSEVFASAGSAHEVHQRSQLLMSWLNGALALGPGSQPIRAGGIIEFRPDGTERKHAFAESHITGRGRSKGYGVALGPDGQPLPPPPPAPSNVQNWMRVSEQDDLLSDAVVYYSRTDSWFDIYKSLECLILRFGGPGNGSEQRFKKLGWASVSRIDLLKQTANYERHARRKFDPPDTPMPMVEARELLGHLLRRAFEEARK